MNRLPRRALVLAAAALFLRIAQAGASIFDPAPLKAEGWAPALKAFAAWSQTPPGAALLEGDPSWSMLGIINLEDPLRLGELAPLVRELRAMSGDGGAGLRRDMLRMPLLEEPRQREIVESLRQARTAAADDVVRGVEALMDAHVRRQKLLRGPEAARGRIAEVGAVLVPLSHLTFYDPGEVGARYNEALIKLDNLRRALARMEANAGPSDEARPMRLGPDRVLDAPAGTAPRRDPYAAARQLAAAMRERGVTSPRVLVSEGSPQRLVVQFGSPGERDKVLDLFNVEPDVSLSYRGVPVRVLLPR